MPSRASPPPAAPAFIELEGFSEKALSALLPTSSSEHVQLGRGRLGGRIALLPLESGAMRRVTFSIAMRFRSTLQHDTVNLVIAQNAPDGTRVSGMPIATGALLAVDADVDTDASLAPGVLWTGLRLPRRDYLRAWSASTDRDPPWTGGFGAVRLGSDHRAALDDLIEQVETVARDRPDLFGSPVWRANVQRTLLDRFVSNLLDATETDLPAPPSRKAAGEIVRLVDEFLSADGDAVVTVPDVCEALRVGRRTLERAVADAIGCSPKEYLKLRALRMVREALLDPARAGDSITSIAMEYGFWHLGRFSLFYREHFLESPSQTRRAFVRRLARIEPLAA